MAVAIAVVLVAAAIVPFLNPLWVAFAQERAEATAWTGFTRQELSDATGRVLGDLLTGGGFVIPMGSGVLLLDDREIVHMQDVQRVFTVFGLLALGAATALIGLRRIGGRRWWAAARASAVGLAAGVFVLGMVGAFAFEVAFEVFHGLFFASGSYTFDPRTDRLVQLFPQRFWFETSMAVGAVILVLAGIVATVATRRLHARRPVARALPALETAG